MALNLSTITRCFLSTGKIEDVSSLDVIINAKYVKKSIYFLDGYKYCSSCEYLIKTTIDMCPICGNLLSTRIRNNKMRTRHAALKILIMERKEKERNGGKV